MFRGCFEHSIDEKGRVSIPVSFRKVLQDLHDERLVITKFVINSFRCLDVYPQAEWENLEQQLLSKPRFDETFFKLGTFYLGNAQECAVDKQGRVLLPPLLRDYAGIKKDVMFVSALKIFRIWDNEIWQQFNTESEKYLSAHPDSFGKFDA